MALIDYVVTNRDQDQGEEISARGLTTIKL